MRNTIQIILRIVVLTLFAGTTMPSVADTLIWSIEPQYQDFKPFYRDVFIFENNGKYGLRTLQKILIPSQYDFITPFYNGFSLVGEKHGDALVLKMIINEQNGNITNITSTYLLSNKYPVFSDGLLIVMNQKGKYGYISPGGAEVIRCQYQDVLPYKEGFMSVKKKLWHIVSPSGNPGKPRTLVVNFNNNDMTAASCFSGGRAAVAYNDDYAMINRSGEKVQKITGSDFRRYYKDFCELTPAKSPVTQTLALSPTMASFQGTNGLWGITSGGKVIVEPQFKSLSQIYADNTAIAESDGRFGLLKIIEGDVSSGFRAARGNGVTAEKDGSLSNLIFEVQIPSGLGFNGGKIMIDRGNGVYSDLTAAIRVNGTKRTVEFTPVLTGKDAKEVTVRARVSSNAFSVPDQSRTFTVSHPAVLRLSAPGPKTVRANEHNVCTVSATVYNDSSQPVTVSTSWGGQITIPAHGSKSVYKSYSGITVQSVKTVSISLSTGLTRTSTITFIPYF